MDWVKTETWQYKIKSATARGCPSRTSVWVSALLVAPRQSHGHQHKRSSHGQPVLNSREKASMTIMNSQGLNTPLGNTNQYINGITVATTDSHFWLGLVIHRLNCANNSFIYHNLANSPIEVLIVEPGQQKPNNTIFFQYIFLEVASGWIWHRWCCTLVWNQTAFHQYVVPNHSIKELQAAVVTSM